MRVAVRTDASVTIGTGHVMRCLALAGELRARGAQVVFLCRELPGHLCAAIETEGFAVVPLPQPSSKPVHPVDGPRHAQWLGVPWKLDAAETVRVLDRARRWDWLVVDHYALDARWERAVRARAERVLAIDDLADREHEVDLLVDPTLPADESKYNGRVDSQVRLLLGPAFALLRREFAELRQKRLPRSGKVRRLLAFFGGADPTCETEKFLKALSREDLGDVVETTVIVGSANERAGRLVDFAGDLRGVVIEGPTRKMAEHMARADLMIGTAGTTTWERCCLGLASVIVSVAQNQHVIARETARAGACLHIGPAERVGPAAYLHALHTLLADPRAVAVMSEAAAKLNDGLGAQRVADAMTRLATGGHR